MIQSHRDKTLKRSQTLYLLILKVDEICLIEFRCIESDRQLFVSVKVVRFTIFPDHKIKKLSESLITRQ